MPGDIIDLANGPAPCDGLVVQGGCVVNESMLTGEPMPIQKFVVDAGNQKLEGKLAARHQVRTDQKAKFSVSTDTQFPLEHVIKFRFYFP